MNIETTDGTKLCKIRYKDTGNTYLAKKLESGEYVLLDAIHYNTLDRACHDFPSASFIIYTGITIEDIKTDEELGSVLLEMF